MNKLIDYLLEEIKRSPIQVACGFLIFLITIIGFVGPIIWPSHNAAIPDYSSGNDPVLSYNLSPPIKIFDENSIIFSERNASKISINNRTTSDLFLLPIRIWNSDASAIDNFDIYYDFKEKDQKNDFNIFAIIHNVSPQSNFGIIKSSRISNSSIKCSYGYLERNDGFTIFFLINKLADIYVKKIDKKFELKRNVSPSVTVLFF